MIVVVFLKPLGDLVKIGFSIGIVAPVYLHTHAKPHQKRDECNDGDDDEKLSECPALRVRGSFSTGKHTHIQYATLVKKNNGLEGAPVHPGKNSITASYDMVKVKITCPARGARNR